MRKQLWPTRDLCRQIEYDLKRRVNCDRIFRVKHSDTLSRDQGRNADHSMRGVRNSRASVKSPNTMPSEPAGVGRAARRGSA